MRLTRAFAFRLLLAITMVSLLSLGVRPFLVHTKADRLLDRSVRVHDPTQGAMSGYTFTFKIVSGTTLGSIRFQFCSDTPLIGQPCTPPVGFNGSGSQLISQYGEFGFTELPSTSDNVITIGRAPAVATPTEVSYTFKDVTNPSLNGSYYVRVETFATPDATGPNTDYGGLSYVINDRIDISTEVPPYLLLCSGVVITGYDCATASGDYLNFGELSSTATKAATSSLVLATNAANGYGLYVDGATMASGTDILDELSAADVSRPGVTQFGLNLTANTTPVVGAAADGPGIGLVTAPYDIPDRFRFVPGEQLASAATASDYRKYTVSYIINISKHQPPGVYVTTLNYVAVANF